MVNGKTLQEFVKDNKVWWENILKSDGEFEEDYKGKYLVYKKLSHYVSFNVVDSNGELLEIIKMYDTNYEYPLLRCEIFCNLISIKLYEKLFKKIITYFDIKTKHGAYL